MTEIDVLSDHDDRGSCSSNQSELRVDVTSPELSPTSTPASSPELAQETPKLSFGISQILSGESSRPKCTASDIYSSHEKLSGLSSSSSGIDLFSTVSQYSELLRAGMHMQLKLPALLSNGMLKLSPHRLSLTGSPSGTPGSYQTGGTPVGISSLVFPWMHERKDRLTG